MGQLLRGAHDSHAAPAAACLGLQENRVAHFPGPRFRLLGGANHAIGAGKNGHLGSLHRLTGFFLLAHQARDLRRRADELDVRGAADLGEVGVLAQQPIAGMDCFHIGDLRGGDDRRHVQITVRQARRADANSLVGKTNVQRVAVRLAVDGDRANAQFPAGVHNPQRDFTPIGNQYLTKHSGPFERG